MTEENQTTDADAGRLEHGVRLLVEGETDL